MVSKLHDDTRLPRPESRAEGEQSSGVVAADRIMMRTALAVTDATG
jgi:hypothetical protein